tara:strand:+ start:424 stop:963 length:540 start_codon:yes stop_codon:yes gene_type:complete
MYEFMKSDKTVIMPSTIENAGLGVFAKEDIFSGEVIEVSPVKLMHTDMMSEDVFNDSWLSDYAFKWNEQYSAIVLGWGSMINHNLDLCNVVYHGQSDPMAMVFLATKRIQTGEEIFTRYYHPTDAHHQEFDFGRTDVIKSAPSSNVSNNAEFERIARRRRHRVGTFKDFHRIKNDSNTS